MGLDLILIQLMGIVRANFRISGELADLGGIALVDTGSSLSLVEQAAAEKLGLRPTGRSLKLVTLSGEELHCSEALTSFLELEGECLAQERVGICRFPETVIKKLRTMRLHPQVIIGLISLEAAGFAPNPRTGKLEKVGWIALSSR